MRAMKDSGVEWIGEIPQEWEVIKFKYLHTGMNTGEGIDKTFWSTNEMGKIFYTAGLVPIRTTYLEFPEWKFTEENDLLFARNGTPYVYYPEKGACYTDHIIRAKMKKEVNKRFVQYCLQQSISSIVVESVSIATWSASLWDEQLIPYPTSEQQKRIVDYLDSKCSKIDAIIERQQAVIEKLKEYKLSVITETVTKGLNPDVEMKDSGVEWIGEVPDGWTTYKLKYLLQERNDAIRVGPFGSQLTSKDFVDDGFWVYTQRNVLDKDFMKTDTFITNKKFNDMKGFSVEAGDILVTARGTGTTGHIVKVPTEFAAGIIHPCLMKFKLDENKCAYEFLYYVFEFAKYLRTQIDVANNTSSLPVLYSNTLCNLYVVVPPKDIQRDLIKWLDKKTRELDGCIEKRKQMIDKLTEYKKSLIYEVVTGKKEV